MACTDAPRLLRPAKVQGLYGNWSEYVEDSSGGWVGGRVSDADGLLVWIHLLCAGVGYCVTGRVVCFICFQLAATSHAASFSPLPRCAALSLRLADEGAARLPLTLGRGEGRVSRRRKRQATQKERESVKRSLMAERRQKVKEVMAALGQQQSEQQSEQQQQQPGQGLGAAAAERAERLARLERLRELRLRLAASATQA